jgi:hypothetical protein
MFVVLMIVFIQALFMSLIYGMLIAGMWRVFEKAGKPGWAAIVPIYNAWLMVEIAKKPVSWFILLLIPCVGAIFGILLCIEIAKVFGQSAGYGVGLALLGPVFFPMLGFGAAKYQPELAAAPPPRRARYEDEDEDQEEEERPRRRPRR